MRHKHKKPLINLKTVPVTAKGTFNRRICAEGFDDKREYSLHATKGYRSYRKPMAKAAP